MTPTTPVQLTAYRERHRIESIRDFDEDTGRLYDVCAHDGIRVYQRSPGRLAHDRNTIRSLAALERGEGIRW